MYKGDHISLYFQKQKNRILGFFLLQIVINPLKIAINVEYSAIFKEIFSDFLLDLCEIID